MKKYKGIVVGCGKIGVLFEGNEGRPHPRSHAGALTENPHTELAAGVCRDEAERDAAREFFPETPFFTDLAHCLEEVDPDIAIIAASTSVHAQLTIQCAETGVPIIIGEKPFAADMASAVSMARALNEHGTTFALNYQRRYFPLFGKAREAIARGELGKIHTVRCLYDNGLFNNGGHALDSVSYLLGEQMVLAMGTLNAKNTTHPQGDENIEGSVLTDRGTKILLQSFDQKVTPIHELYLSGEKGELAITDYGYSFAWVFKDDVQNRTERDAITMTGGVLDDALRAYEEERVPKSSVENGMHTLAALEALKASTGENGVAREVEYTH